ncbi:DUF4382 domain-containing protein [Neiella sp. HB171785]|uniref:DUF4382 domain-containing protein n=1 Tax=Neiella litorisoli TaxID=2771431 RepID=A0A8J6QGT0_9GAMM|nr:DUF4382 domain-containing protein [Neiella litorisoli]MBD1389180.1 DUF4382 domain-containing protein [Neiella litorisoli]
MLKPVGIILSCCCLVSCGGSSSNSGDNPTTSLFSLAISDAPVDDANKVVITIDRVTLRNPSGDDVVFDTFNNSEEGIVDADTVQIDLLEYAGSKQFQILEDERILAGDYSDMLLEILDEDETLSYVEETDGSIKPIKVPSDELKLGSFTIVEADQTQAFTVEFNLRKSMTYKPGPDEYNLKPRGVTLVETSQSGTIGGNVDWNAMLAEPSCASSGHLVYLYSGVGVSQANMSDEFDSEDSNNGAPSGAIAPFASTAVAMDEETGLYSYEFGFVPVGDYTLAYACDLGEGGDDPDIYDGIDIPNPLSSVAEVTLTAGGSARVDFPDASSAPEALTLGISDAPVDDVDEVVVTVDVVTFKQSGTDDQIFDCFLVDAEEGDVDDESCPTSDTEGKVYADLVSVNLLDYTGGKQFILLDGVEIAAGDYQDVWLDVFDEDTEYAYVNEQLPEEGQPQEEAFIKELKVPSGTLKLGGFSYDEQGTQLTIDFNLRKSMTYNPGPDRYILKPRGVSLINNAGTGNITGNLGEALSASDACSAEGAWQIVYLYAGSPTETLGDEYDPESNAGVTAVEPFMSVAANDDGSFGFGFVPAGTHTLAVYCGLEEDDPEDFDGLTIPTPTDSRVDVTVTEGLTTTCDLSVGGC